MISRQLTACAAATVVSLLAVAGCSSSGAKGGAAADSGAASATASSAAAQNVGLTEQQLLDAFKKAAGQATAVHVKGAMDSGGQKVSLDLQLNKQGASASGTISDNGAVVPVIAVNDTTYVQMTDSVLKMAGNIPASAAALLKDKWVSSKSSIGSGMAGQFGRFSSYDSFISSIVGSSDGLLAGTHAAGTTTYNGQSVAVYKDGDGSITYFAATGPAYLLEMQSGATSVSGTLDFTWNQPTTVTAPPASQIFTGGK
jgi:hypothetical protein